MPEYKAPQQPVFYRRSTNDGHKVKARQRAHSVVLEKWPEEWSILHLPPTGSESLHERQQKSYASAES